MDYVKMMQADTVTGVDASINEVSAHRRSVLETIDRLNGGRMEALVGNDDGALDRADEALRNAYRDLDRADAVLEALTRQRSRLADLEADQRHGRQLQTIGEIVARRIAAAGRLDAALREAEAAMAEHAATGRELSELYHVHQRGGGFWDRAPWWRALVRRLAPTIATEMKLGERTTVDDTVTSTADYERQRWGAFIRTANPGATPTPPAAPVAAAA